MFYKVIRAILLPFIHIFFVPRIIGKDNMISNRKCIIVSNHISAIDPVVVGCLLPGVIHFMAKVELFSNPFIGWLLSHLNAFPVKRGTADITAIKKSLQILKDGKMLGIFPEGTRSKSGEIKDFESGVAVIALKSQSPIIPVVIHNRYKIFRPTYITVGKPIDLSKYKNLKASPEIIEEVTGQLALIMRELLHQSR